VQLDFINARAKFALSYQGVRPQISKQFYVKGLSHPLLYLQFKGTGKEVIPSNFILDDNVLSVIISGPNTGGKTVFLKSVGLSAYMLKAGLFVAAFEAKLPLFSQILADIGDEQSLEQNLSTFSSHMTNIIEVINLAKPDTLIILDEIGAGTDPKEGSALAQALLEHLKAQKALTITSTHYSEIKAIAFKDPAYINASLSFDEATLTPTYKLYLGQPGSSKGITIAKRLGLKDVVVEAAKSLIDADAIYLDEVSRELEAKLKEVSAKEEQLQDQLAQSEKLQANLQAELEELRYEKLKFKAQLKQRLKDELKEAETFVKDTIAQLQKGPTMQSAQSLQKKVKEKVAQINNMDDEAEIPSQATSSSYNASFNTSFNIGAKVKIKSLRQTGNVLAVIGDKQNPAELIYEIQAGSFKVKVKADDLEAYIDNADSQVFNTKLKKKLAKLGLGASKVRSKSSSKSGNQVIAAQLGDVFVRSSENTLDLRGKRVDESLAILDQFLNEAVVSNMHSVMIIHGHGTGAVKSAVRQALDSFSQLESYRPGENYEGGDGVTVVFF
jgi:DNA mismatch repair protein MutS2